MTKSRILRGSTFNRKYLCRMDDLSRKVIEEKVKPCNKRKNDQTSDFQVGIQTEENGEAYTQSYEED